MILPFKQVLKKPDLKTLELSGEEKSRSTISLCLTIRQRNLLPTVSPSTTTARFKEENVNARGEEKDKSPMMLKIKSKPVQR